MLQKGIAMDVRQQSSSPCAKKEGRWGSGDTDLWLFNLGITLVNSMTRPFRYLWNIPRQPLNTRAGLRAVLSAMLISSPYRESNQDSLNVLPLF